LWQQSWSFHAAGNQTSYNDPDGNRTDQGYDAQGNVIFTAFYNAAGALVKSEAWTFDPAGYETSHTDIDGNTTTKQYNSLGLAVQETTRAGNTLLWQQSWSFDAARNK